MALPQTREQLRDWCLKKLGAPVIEINLDEEQIEDRIDEALSFFRDFHFDGIDKYYLRHKITASTLSIVALPVGEFIGGEQITGSTSGATAVFLDITNTIIRARQVVGTFQDGEEIVGQNGATATLIALDAVVLGDIDNRYIVVDDSIIGVIDILAFGVGLPVSGNFFDINYQFFQNTNMSSLVSQDLISYDMFRRQMELLRQEFQGVKGFRFNRNSNKIFIDIDWRIGGPIKPDEYFVLLCYKAVDPEAYTKVYGDYFVREYTYALIKKNWGEAIKKYSGVALPGNTTVNGQIIYDEAVDYIEKLEQKIERRFSEPVDFLFG